MNLLKNLTKVTSVLGVFAVAIFAFTSSAQAQGLPVSPSPEGAELYIVSPADGDTIEGGSVKVVFGLKGMGVAPAGIEMENTGHHHLLVNQAELPEEGKPMGADPIHFGKGQTETTIELEPGTHTLQLILGNHLHIPHNPPVVSEKITITVK